MARNERSETQMPERRQRDTGGFGVDTLRNEMNRLFDRLGGGASPTPGRRASDSWPEPAWFGRDPMQPLESAFGGPQADTFGSSDLSETEQGYELQMDLPGVPKKDVSLDYSNGILTVSCERQDEQEVERKGYYLSERTYGRYRRSFRIPESVDHDNISARFAKGVLTVELPKTSEAQQSSRRIEVQEG
jgi:HSP20 family protein